MIQDAQSIPIKRTPHRRNHTEAVAYLHHDHQEQNQVYSKQDLFMKKFKNNQNSLKTKFKKYLQQKKTIFPNTYLNLSHFQNSHDKEQIKNIRQVRQQKKKLISDLNQSMNQSRYALNKKKSFQITYSLLSNKMKRVEKLRRERKSQVIRMEQTMRSISQEIRQQKMQFKRKVDQSKYSLLKSRMQKSHQKMILADTVRTQTEQHQKRISQQKFIIFQEKIDKCRTVREEEKKVQLNVSRVYEQKKSRAQQLKLQKLFRQLAEKEEIKIISARIKKDTNKISKMQNQTLDLQKKIRQYRKSLGQRRLDPPPKISLPKCNRVHSEEHQFSTNSELLSQRKKYGDYSYEGFEDDY